MQALETGCNATGICSDNSVILSFSFGRLDTFTLRLAIIRIYCLDVTTRPLYVASLRTISHAITYRELGEAVPQAPDTALPGCKLLTACRLEALCRCISDRHRLRVTRR